MATQKRGVKSAPAKKAAPAIKAPAKKAAPAMKMPEKKSVHHVYVIRVERLTSTGTFDYYVGSTGQTLEDKWKRYQTLSSKRLSSHFLKGHVRAVALETTLMKGWGPYESDELAKFAEGELALHLQDRGYAVYSDELKWAVRRRKKSGVVFEVPVWNSRSHAKLAKAAAEIRPSRSRAVTSTVATLPSPKAPAKKAPAKKAPAKKSASPR